MWASIVGAAISRPHAEMYILCKMLGKFASSYELPNLFINFLNSIARAAGCRPYGKTGLFSQILSCPDPPQGARRMRWRLQTTYYYKRPSGPAAYSLWTGRVFHMEGFIRSRLPAAVPVGRHCVPGGRNDRGCGGEPAWPSAGNSPASLHQPRRPDGWRPNCRPRPAF